MALTSAQQESVRRAEAELARAVAYSSAWLKAQTGGLTGELLLNHAERAAVKNTRVELERAESWRTTWRRWAEAGFDDKQHAYPVGFYLQVGKDIASALNFHTKAGFNASAFNLIGEAAEKKVAAANKAAEEALAAAGDAAKRLAGPWSLKTKAKLAGAATLLICALGVVAARRSE
ncbi:MAG TPA: hypothetical protein VK539_03110 [Myxococcaceae bacterium]|nr:hypothetical protein [Myxococcaceae bacterium]